MINFKVLCLVFFIAIFQCLSFVSSREIIVKGPNDKKETFTLGEDSTVSQLKHSIAREFLVPVEKQILFSDGTKLDDDNQSIAFYQISAVQLVEKPKNVYTKLRMVQIDNKVTYGTIEAELNDTVEKLRAKLYSELNGLHVSKFIIENDGKLHDLLSDSFELKEYLLNKDEVIVYFEPANDDYEIYLQVELPNGQVETLRIGLSDTIETLKAEYEFEYNIPVGEQRLYLNDIELDDAKQVREYNIYEWPTVKLVTDFRPRRKISVSYLDAIELTLDVYADEPIETIRSMIYHELNIPTHLQELTIFDQSESSMWDGKRLSYYATWAPLITEIKLKKISDFDGRTAGLRIDLPTGGHFDYHFHYNETRIIDIKQRIERDLRNGPSKEQIRLFLNDLELLNGMKIDDYGISFKSYMVAKYDDLEANEKTTHDETDEGNAHE